jgi:hypothetical protein
MTFYSKNDAKQTNSLFGENSEFSLMIMQLVHIVTTVLYMVSYLTIRMSIDCDSAVVKML